MTIRQIHIAKADELIQAISVHLKTSHCPGRCDECNALRDERERHIEAVALIDKGMREYGIRAKILA